MIHNKFRVWCKNKNRWEEHPCYLSRTGVLYQIVYGSLIPCLKDTHIVQFSSGSMDKLEKEIYKGDIIEIQDRFKNTCEVEYKHGSFGFQWHIWKPLLGWHKSYLKIVGNKFQNLELLK